MDQFNKSKFLFSLSIGIMLLWSGCVDTSVENIPTNIGYTSMVKFVNEVPGETTTVTIDGGQVSTVQSGGESSYVEASSGSRNVTATYSNGPNVSETVFFETDYKITVSIVEDTTGARSFVKTLEGYK